MNELEKLIVVEKDARAFGFEWPNIEMAIEQAISECREVQDAVDQKESSARIQEEIGDLLHTAISLCIFAGFDVNETLSLAEKKFSGRMQHLKELTKKQGLQTLHGKSTDFMLKLWYEAKKLSS